MALIEQKWPFKCEKVQTKPIGFLLWYVSERAGESCTSEVHDDGVGGALVVCVGVKR